MMIRKNKLMTVVLTGLLSSWVMSLAMAAHVHGQANMTVLLDDQLLTVEVSIPGFDVVGFEHEPTDSEDELRIDSAVLALKDANKWLNFETAKCHKKDVKLKTPFAAEESDEHSKHHNFELVVHYICDNPSMLDSMTLTLHDKFPSIEQTEVQWLIHDKQGLTTVTRQIEIVRFR